MAGRPELSHGPLPGERAERGDVGRERRQAAGQSLDERVAGRLPMAAGDEQIRRPHQLLDPCMGHRAEEMNPALQTLIRRNAPPYLGQEGAGAETTPELESRQLGRGGGDSVENRQRVLVGIEVADPEDRRIAGDAGVAPCREPIAGHEPAARLGSFVHRGAARQDAGLDERAGLLPLAERDAGDGPAASLPRRSPPPARRPVGMVLQQDGNSRRGLRHEPHRARESEPVNVQHLGSHCADQRGEGVLRAQLPAAHPERQKVIVDLVPAEVTGMSRRLNDRHVGPGHCDALRDVHQRRPRIQQLFGGPVRRVTVKANLRDAHVSVSR